MLAPKLKDRANNICVDQPCLIRLSPSAACFVLGNITGPESLKQSLLNTGSHWNDFYTGVQSSTQDQVKSN